MENTTKEKIRIPHAAAQIAASATTTQDEFEAVGELRFPSLRHSEPLFGADFKAPLLWVYYIRVYGNESIRTPNLYIAATNRGEQRLVRYNTAALPGGAELELHHINFHREENLFDKSLTSYTEHMSIVLTPKMLSEYLDKPLRIRVSNPREGVQFIVEVPADYIAGVLYRLDPDCYEFDAPLPRPEIASSSPGAPVDPGWIKKAGWVGAGLGLFGLFFGGATVALLFAFFGFAGSALFFHKSVGK